MREPSRTRVGPEETGRWLPFGEGRSDAILAIPRASIVGRSVGTCSAAASVSTKSATSPGSTSWEGGPVRSANGSDAVSQILTELPLAAMTRSQQ